MFPSSAIADYLLSNRAHRKLVIQCLQDAGFGEYGYDTSDAMIVPAMIDSFRIPLRWVAPPANFVPDREIPPGLRPSDPNAVGWVPPEMPADRLAAFEDAINVCENAPYPSSVDWKLAEGIDGEMIALADEATHSDGFVSLQKAFETCIETRGGKMSQESPAGEFMIDAANPVDGDKFDAQAVDSACRTDLYPAFIELKRDEWREWLDRREGDLKELADKWAQLEKEAGIG